MPPPARRASGRYRPRKLRRLRPEEPVHRPGVEGGRARLSAMVEHETIAKATELATQCAHYVNRSHVVETAITVLYELEARKRRAAKKGTPTP